VSIRVITQGIWPRISAAARRSKQPAHVAVAYFGQGAAKLLPLPRGSRLVVDASEGAVKSGQTCPAELKKLMKTADVRVYSVPNLHAKVFVFGPTAVIGSTNASWRSAGTLVEAAVAITDRKAVSTARQFVRSLCLHELGPKGLEHLQRMYRPPRIAGNRGRRQSRHRRVVRPELPRLLLAQLRPFDPPDGSEKTEKAGRQAGRKRMSQPRRHVLEDFWWSGRCPYRLGDIVVQVMREDDSRRMASPPGEVVHTAAWRRGATSWTFVYVELPRGRRASVERLAKRIGSGALKRLRRGGQVNRNFAERLLAAWSA